jgi:hypothetical protein
MVARITVGLNAPTHMRQRQSDFRQAEGQLRIAHRVSGCPFTVTLEIFGKSIG